MYILDTDHLSLIQRNREEGKRILTRLAAVEGLEVAVTVITYEEQIRGRLNLLSRAETLDEQVFAYQVFKECGNSVPGIQLHRSEHNDRPFVPPSAI